jgi:integrase
MRREKTMNKKRGQNEGSIYQRKDGRWAGAVSLGGGKRKTVYGRTAEEARQKITDVKRQVSDGTFVLSDHLTIEQLSRQYIESLSTTVRRSTYRRYERLLSNHVLPFIGMVEISKLQPAQLESIYSRILRKGLSAQSAVHVHRVVHAMLAKATRWQIVGRNVASLVKPPRVEYREMRTLTPQEVKRLFAAAPGTRYEALWRVAIGTGMRVGEILALKWQFVDFDRRSLRVVATLESDPDLGLINSEPKTQSSRRTIHLTDSVLRALESHRARQNQERMKLGDAWTDNDYVFASAIGTPVIMQNLGRRDFKNLCKSAGITGYLRMHDLRHTAISLALSAGVAPTDVANMAGHSNVAVTLQRYAHALPEAPRRAADAIERLVAGS